MLCFPVMTLGGEIVIMPAPDLAEFLALIGQHRVTHAFLPPTLIYLLLDHPALADADLTSLQCLWYGAAPMSAARLEQAIARDRPGHGAAVRPDRGADDDLHAWRRQTTCTPTARWRPSASPRPGGPRR